MHLSYRLRNIINHWSYQATYEEFWGPTHSPNPNFAIAFTGGFLTGRRRLLWVRHLKTGASLIVHLPKGVIVGAKTSAEISHPNPNIVSPRPGCNTKTNAAHSLAILTGLRNGSEH